MANDSDFLIEAALDISSTVQNIQAQLKQVESQLKPINLDVKVNSNNINQVQSQTAKVTKSTQDLSAQLSILQNRATGAYGSFLKYLNQNSQAAEKLPAQVAAIKEQYASLQSATELGTAKQSLQQMTSQVTAFKGKVREAGLEGKTFGEQIQADLSKFTQWVSVGTIIMSAVNEVKQMIQNVEDLSKSMVNIQIASGASTSEAQNMMTTYSQMGEQLGATTVEVANSADDFLRQGKSVAETNTLIKDSMMLSKLGEIDSTSATQYLTSAMKGYGISVNDTVGIVDKLTKVDQISATSAGGLAEAMSRTANVANISGVSMNKLIGYLATVGETTQKSMDEVGTSFQAIFSRMGNVKAGKFVDDSTGEALNDVESVLKKVGIQLRDGNGQFRNFGTVLDEVAAKWKSYDSVQQNAITTAIAGTRQRENLTVLLNNYTTATKYAETAQNSAGTATQKMSVYQQGLEAHLKSAQAAFEQFSSTVINSNALSGLVDTGTGFINVLNTITSKLGTIPTLISAISLGASLLGKNAGKQYAHLLKVA